MKVNLIINEDRMKEGYENIPLNETSVEGIPDSACKELMIDNVFEFIPEQLAPTILKKIRKGGTLEIRSPDGEEICRQLQVGALGFEDAFLPSNGGEV